MKTIIVIAAIALTACASSRPYERQAWAKSTSEQATSECSDEMKRSNSWSSMRSCMESKGWKEI